jgi:hypothetical protein
MLLKDASWSDIERLRTAIGGLSGDSLEAAADMFAALFTDTFESVVLSRVFVVMPFAELPTVEQRIASAFVQDDARLTTATPVLCLLGTRGKERAWNDRKASVGHRVIPLLDRAFVTEAPMLAKLLADLEVDLDVLDDGGAIFTRRMLGARNGTFYVPDAPHARDERGRAIIPAQDFLARYGVQTVFGMGGAYLHGALVVSILFSSETLDRLTVDRFPSLISNFKMATATLMDTRRVFATP